MGRYMGIWYIVNIMELSLVPRFPLSPHNRSPIPDPAPRDLPTFQPNFPINYFERNVASRVISQSNMFYFMHLVN